MRGGNPFLKPSYITSIEEGTSPKEITIPVFRLYEVGGDGDREGQVDKRGTGE